MDTHIQRFLDFAKVTGQDVATATNTVALTLKAFGRNAGDAEIIMDRLLRTQQDFGVDTGNLTRILSENAGTFSALGLDLEDSIALMAAMSNEGINVSRAAMGLRGAIDDFESPEDFKTAMTDLAGITDNTERAKRAMEIFGSFGGPGLAKLMGQGSDALEKFKLAEDDVRGATERAAAEFDGNMNVKMELMKRKVISATASFASFAPGITAVAAVSREMAPALGLLSGALGTLAIKGAPSAIKAMGLMSLAMGPGSLIILAIAGLVAAGILISKNWDKIAGFAKTIWDRTGGILTEKLGFIAGLFSVPALLGEGIVAGWETVSAGAIRVWDAINTVLDTKIGRVILLLSGPIGVGILLIKNWEKVRDTGRAVWYGVKNALKNPVSLVLAVLRGPLLAGETLLRGWETIREKARGMGEYVLAQMRTMRDGAGVVWRAMKGTATTIFHAMLTPLLAPWRGLLEFMETMINRMPGWLRGKIPGVNDILNLIREGQNRINQLTLFAKGGVINEPTLLTSMRTGRTFGMMGEAGPERIVPGGGGGAQHIHVYLDGVEIENFVLDRLGLRARLQFGAA